MDGQLVMDIPLEEPDERIAVTIKKVAFYYKIRKSIFAIETKAGQIIFLVLDLEVLTLYSHSLLLIFEFEVKVIDSLCLPN